MRGTDVSCQEKAVELTLTKLYRNVLA